MSEDEDFAALFEASQGKGKHAKKAGVLEAGKTIEGTVIAVSDDVVFVDVGVRVEAQLPTSEVTGPGKPTVAVGDRIKAVVVDAGAGGRAAQLRLSLSGASGSLDASALQTAVTSGLPVEGEFKTVVRAGIEVDLGGVRAFCPASQVDVAYVQDLEVFVGQKHFFRVLEVRDGGRSVVVSRKALLLEQRKRDAEALLARIEPGAELEGIVQSLQPYGAFIDLGGIQGLLHVSEISRGRIGSPSDALSVGESVRVQVLAVERGPSGPPRISLSMKALVQAPAAESEPVAVVQATVSKVENFGLLVDTPLGSGLVPTAELEIPRGSDPRRTYKPGSVLDVVVQRRGGGAGKLRFSARAVREVEEKQAFAAFSKGKGESDALGSLGDLLRGIELPDEKKKARRTIR